MKEVFVISPAGAPHYFWSYSKDGMQEGFDGWVDIFDTYGEVENKVEELILADAFAALQIQKIFIKND